MRSLRFSVTLAAASLLVVASVGIASAAPSAKEVSRDYEQSITTQWTNQPAVPLWNVTYTVARVNGWARHAAQAGSGFHPTGPIVASETSIEYVRYYFDGTGEHTTFTGTVRTSAFPVIDASLAYGIAGGYVPGVGRVEVGCAAYGTTFRGYWTWTGGYAPNVGWTTIEPSRSRACVPTLFVNGAAQPGGTSPGFGMIGMFTYTAVSVYPR